MILKKPYAFLIKYFKLIHIVLLGLMIYLLYRTNIVLNFFQEYISSNQLITGKDFTGQLFNIYMFAIPFIIIVFLIVLLGVMYYKKKPMIFYVYNIVIMISVLVFYNLAYDVAGTLEMQVIDTKTLRLYRDLYMIVIIFQGLSVILTFIRATGFDIKKFDFGHDLEELDITEADNEEFEVDVDIETNVLKRDFNKRLRFFRYIYLENKFIINTVFLILFSIICFTLYMNLTIYNKSYNQTEMFLGNEFTMEVSNSFLTNEDYKGKVITDNYLVIIELKVRANYSKEAKLNTTKAELKVGNQIFFHSNKYRSKLIDLGHTYENGVISRDDFQKELLVYEIPKSLMNEKMILNYIDDIESNHNKLNPKYISVNIKPYSLISEDKIESKKLETVNVINKMVLKDTSIFISSFEMQNKFVLNYKYCNKGECYNSIEYIKPRINTNYDKSLIKIEGTTTIDETIKSNNIYNLYSIISLFGKIRYELNGTTKYYTELKQVSSNRVELQDVYYFEIPTEILDSEKISLIVDVRDKSLEYSIK